MEKLIITACICGAGSIFCDGMKTASTEAVLTYYILYIVYKVCNSLRLDIHSCSSRNIVKNYRNVNTFRNGSKVLNKAVLCCLVVIR